MAQSPDDIPDRAEGHTSPEAAEVAADAGLRYVLDTTPGIRRRRAGKGFSYRGPDGHFVRDARTLERIRSLAIPPAWTDVWICPDPRGHLQATGRDARGRKQYRYHPLWQRVRDASKYEHVLAFARALPRIRAAVDRDLARRGTPRERVLAAVTRLLDETSIRVGNQEYRRENHSYGLTTLQDRHVRVEGETMRFHFRGKSGKEHDVELQDRRLARVVQHSQDIPGQELFQYVDDAGERRSIRSEDVNAYLKEIGDGEFTAKDFRTWNGTVLASRLLCETDPPVSEAQGKKHVVAAIKQVARELGNTPAVCRKAYVHPQVIDAYLTGDLAPNAVLRETREVEVPDNGLSEEEQRVLRLLLAMKGAADDGTEERKAA